MAREETPRIALVYYAVPNEDKNRGGFMPVYEKNGKVHGTTYGRGYDLSDAEHLALNMANDEASHYSGDWDVTITPKRTAKLALVPGSEFTTSHLDARKRRTKQKGAASLGIVVTLAALGGCAWLFGQGRGRR